MSFKKIIGKLHLWLGFGSGLIVLFLGITGCILAFQREIELVTVPEQFTEEKDQPFAPPSLIKRKAEAALPGKHIHGIAYGRPGYSIITTFYNEDPEYYYLIYSDPYTAEVLLVKNMDDDFFRIMVNGHYNLWLPVEIGRPITATATLIFLVMMITGMILWWPKNRSASKQRFSIKWDARWRRVNYDLHNVLGFYVTWIAIFLAITGLIFGFQWFADSVYYVTSGGKKMTEFYLPSSEIDSNEILKGEAQTPATSFDVAQRSRIDVLWSRMSKEYPAAEMIEVHIPESDTASIEVAISPDNDVYWKTDYLYFDQYTLEEIPVTHPFGRLANTSAADKIMRMNYDVHVGQVWGLPGKVLAFIASLICASLPVTGVYIWWGRRKKKIEYRMLNSELEITRVSSPSPGLRSTPGKFYKRVSSQQNR